MGDASSRLTPRALRAWLPDIVVASAAGGQELPIAPEAWSCDGSTLFADIAGYTRLTGALARQGPAGAELVGDLLNACFAHVVKEVSAYGGDVLGFAGDAVIACWRGGSLRETVALARECGLAIQSKPLPVPAFLKSEVLQMRVGIGAGRIWLMRLGGYQSTWVFLAAGEPFAQMGPASQDAARGTVMLSPQAQAVAGLALPPSPPAPDDAGAFDVQRLSSFLPDVVLQRVAAGQADWIAELRSTSIAFCTLHDLDFSERGDRERLQTFVRRVQGTAAFLEGTICQLAVDDKGCVLILAFGLPPLGHEDDAIRAIRAAQDLEAALTDLHVRHGLGVATGSTFCGSCGPVERHGYMIIGDPVNRAARLSQRGETGVLCDDGTRDAVAGRLPFEEAAPGYGKGFTDTNRVFRVRADAAPRAGCGVSVRPPTFFVGRRLEVQALRDRLRDFQNGSVAGSAVVVRGDPGVGKTSLVASVVGSLSSTRARVVWGMAEAVENSTAYHGWRAVFNELLEAGADGANAATQRQQIEARVADASGTVAWAPLLTGILPITLPENDTTRQMSGAVRGQTTLRLLLLLLERASQQRRVVVVLDDVQWLDASSWQLVRALGRRRASLLQVLISRVAETISNEPLRAGQRMRWLNELIGQPDTLHIELAPMSGEEVRLLVAQSLNVGSVSDEVMSLVAARAQGNPFFARELAYALRDSAALIVDHGHCRLASRATGSATVALPETVRGVVTQRLDHLDPGRLMTLKVASVLGSSFRESELAKVHPISEDQSHIQSHLATLNELNFVCREADTTTWTFSHAIIRDVTYSLIPQAQRAQLHRAAALQFENDERYAWLAHHWRFAGERERWLACLERAGDQAIERGANREAVAFFTQAFQLDDLVRHDDVRRAHWHAQLGDAWYGLGELGKSRYHADEGLRLLGVALPRSTTGWATRGAREALSQSIMLLRGVRPLTSPGDIRRFREASRLMNIVSEQFYFAVDIPKMLASLLATINLAERSGAPDIASRAYGTLGYIVGLGRLHGLGRLYFDHGMRGRDARSRVNTSVGNALYHVAFGRWNACFDALDDGRTRAEAVGDMFGVGLCLNVRADALHLTGAFSEAADVYEELVVNARARSNTQHEVWGLSGLAETLLSQGRFDEAHERLRESGELLAHADRLSAFRHEGIKGAVCFMLDDPAAAAASVIEALRLYQERPAPMYAWYWAVASVLRTAIALWHRQGLQGPPPVAVRRASRLMNRFALVFPIARGQRALLLGYLRWLTGDRAGALPWWRRAAASGEHFGMHHETALAEAVLLDPSRVGALLGAERDEPLPDGQVKLS
jgi:class 3 adenylate cyclase/tetratricopeptide (TPR) repeat protein